MVRNEGAWEGRWKLNRNFAPPIMKVSPAFSLVACCLAFPALAGPVEKNPVVTTQPLHEPWTLPLLGTGVKSNDVYTDGHIYLNVPLWSTIGTDGTLGGSYLFL